MTEHLQYDGRWLTWFDGTFGPPLAFRATSGMPGHQVPAEQCTKDAGPVPEGRYYLLLKVDPGDYARHNGTKNCRLSWSPNIQKIPRGGTTTLRPTRSRANFCEPYWANWGSNRVRIEPANAATKNLCTPRRSGFYLHDSTKGYSHGCIEVSPSFFQHLRNFVKSSRLRRLTLVVKYTHATTYGGTLRP